MNSFLKVVCGAAVLVVFQALPDIASADMVYTCYQKQKGNLRYVDGPGQCLSSEMELPFPDASSAALPEYVPLSVRDITPWTADIGCETSVQQWSSFQLFFAACNDSHDEDEPVGTSVVLMSPVDTAYTYDGLYVCGIVSPDAADRMDSFGNLAVFRVSIYFDELVPVGDGGLGFQNRSSGLNAARRALDFVFDAKELTFAPDATGADPLPCVVLPFADGAQNGDLPLQGDVWIADSEAKMFVRLPKLLPRTTNPFFFGESVQFSQIGLTVNGARPE